MRHPRLSSVSSIFAVTLVGLFAACGGATSTDATNPGGDDGGAGGDGAAASDLPCDVQAILQNSCVSCHGSTPTNNAPMSLVTYDDLTAPAKTDPSKTVAQLSVERIKSTTSPMPPSPNAPLSSADIATFEAWVTGGATKGSCTSGGTDNTNYNTPTTCTSNKTWTGGDRGSSSMHPGRACISCHSSSGGPSMSIAGTVYPTAHEPDDCNGGVSTSLTVVITDSKQQVLKLPVNSVGNFYASRRQSITPPYNAKVVDSNGKERAMTAQQTSGDCNSCHTVDGANGAPGRIMAP